MKHNAFYILKKVQVHYYTTAKITCPGPSAIDFVQKWCKLSLTLLNNKLILLHILCHWEGFQVVGWPLCLLSFLKSRDVSRLTQAQVLAICLAPDFETSCLGTSSLVNPCQCKMKPSLGAVREICCHMNIYFFTRPNIHISTAPEYFNYICKIFIFRYIAMQ